MRNRFYYLLTALLLAMCLCLTLAACNGDGEDVTVPTLAPTEAPTEPADDATDGATEAPTDDPAEETTEAPTEAPTLMTVIDMDGKEGVDAAGFFTRSAKCDLTMVDDETEGKVVRMTTTGISSVGAAAPSSSWASWWRP